MKEASPRLAGQNVNKGRGQACDKTELDRIDLSIRTFFKKRAKRGRPNFVHRRSGGHSLGLKVEERGRPICSIEKEIDP